MFYLVDNFHKIGHLTNLLFIWVRPHISIKAGKSIINKKSASFRKFADCASHISIGRIAPGADFSSFYNFKSTSHSDGSHIISRYSTYSTVISLKRTFWDFILMLPMEKSSFRHKAVFPNNSKNQSSLPWSKNPGRSK